MEPVPAEAVAAELTGRREPHMARQVPAAEVAEALVLFPMPVFPHSKIVLSGILAVQAAPSLREQKSLSIPAPAETAGLEARAEQVLRDVSSSTTALPVKLNPARLSARTISSAWISTDV